MKLKSLAVAIALTGITAAGSITPVVAAETVAAGTVADTTPERTRSAASGLVIGGAIGGPVGAFAGAVIGGEVFGRLFEHQRINKNLLVQIEDLRGQLVAAQSTRSEKDRAIAALNQDLDKVLAVQASTVRKQQLPIQFRTASDDVEQQYEPELKQIALVLRRNKDATVTLNGFADRRGDDTFNQALSEKRVRNVEQYLLRNGVNSGQIVSKAFGESRPLNPAESLEGNFFDRRVVVELNLDIDPQLATR